MKSIATLGLVLGIMFILSGELNAQYFGQNKPRYTSFDFKVVQSPHFEVYHYLGDEKQVEKIVQWSELWYDLHQRILRDTFHVRSPLVFYNNHADFQQTSAIAGQIGVGTGGVTEGLKNRVVMPFAMTNQSTFHVLGHEMVHAFQFHMLLGGDSTGLQSLGNLPLWIVEGMAEYMSIGRLDPHTAMWMRNAVVSEDVPSLRQMTVNPKYFPYRYGQAFWSFLTGLYGDEVIRPLFVATAKFGIERAVSMVLGIRLDDLSEMWVRNIKNFYEPQFKGKKQHPEGRLFLSEDNSGQLNISPSMSPNGQYAVYLSEKSIFSTDLFLVDVRTGKIVRKVHSQARNGNIDHLHYLESSGTWSPDSKRFAYVVFSKGRNKLVITDVQTGKRIDQFALKGVPSFSNPTWSPDGRSIIVSGLVEGQPDLFEVNLRNHNVTRLTNDPYAYIQPVHGFDGKNLVFATDRVSMIEGRNNGAWTYNLAIMDLETRQITDLDIFPGANNMNPIWDDKGNIYFLSDRDGFRNIYRYNSDTTNIRQLTDIITGVSGITRYSPAITISKSGNTLLYTHYIGDGYNIQRARPESMDWTLVDPHDVDMSSAILPPGRMDGADIVNPTLLALDDKPLLPSDSITPERYKAKFKLDYLGGGGGIGVGTSQNFGTRTGLVGGVDMLFSDILGYNQIFTTLALNGEIYDFGGMARYVNTKRKLGYGLSLSHIPIRFGFRDFSRLETVQTNAGPIQAINFPVTVVRYFLDGVNGLAQYTFSRTVRLEGNIGFTNYSLRADQYNNYYVALQSGNQIFPGAFLGNDRQKIQSDPGFGLYSAGTALVGDNSSFGLTSPLQGYRYRIGYDYFTGDFTYSSILFDARKYFWFDKFNVSFRGLHFGRYGTDANERSLGSIFLIDPTLVRGYNNFSLSDLDTLGLSTADIQGSKVAVGNVEIRIPFTGPKRLSAIKSNMLISDLAFFFDAGIAWQNNDQFGESSSRKPQALMSTGVSLRVNLFGAFILEPYFARPLRGTSGWNFGLNFVPGW